MIHIACHNKPLSPQHVSQCADLAHWAYNYTSLAMWICSCTANSSVSDVSHPSSHQRKSRILLWPSRIEIRRRSHQYLPCHTSSIPSLVTHSFQHYHESSTSSIHLLPLKPHKPSLTLSQEHHSSQSKEKFTIAYDRHTKTQQYAGSYMTAFSNTKLLTLNGPRYFHIAGRRHFQTHFYVSTPLHNNY
jgi:hypothetical protein